MVKAGGEAGGRDVDYMARFVRDPKVCGGQTVIRGTRIAVRTVLDSLAEGASVAEIIADYPTLTQEDVRAVIAFAAASASEDIPASPASALR